MKKALTLLATCVVFSATLFSASSQHPLLSLLDYLKIDKAKVLKASPHFPVTDNDADIYQTQLNQWLEKFPKEWNAFKQMVETKNQGIGWVTYGIPSKYIPENVTVNSSWWQWYQAAKIKEEVKQKNFPHFPTLQTNLTGDTLGVNFDRKVGIWQRLYPKEYIAFLNTPQLKSLNASAAEKININYTPRFIGVEISEVAPVLQNTGDELLDQYNYEVAYRNWLFVFMPESFERLYGSDYDYAEGFDKEQYRKQIKQHMAKKKDADWGTGRQCK